MAKKESIMAKEQEVMNVTPQTVTSENNAKVVEGDTMNANETAASDEATDAELEAYKQATGLTEDDEIKAARILRLKMPNLSKHALSLEKRTGNFFKATLIRVTDADGNPVIDEKTGQQQERISRVVVDLFDENGEPTVAAVECADEIAIKRAAAAVTMAEREFTKRSKDVAEAEKALRIAIEARDAFVNGLCDYTHAVRSFELPERETSASTSEKAIIKQELSKKEEENAKLRAILIARGLDPDELLG